MEQELTCAPLPETPPGAIAEWLNRAFHGYIVDVQFSPGVVAHMVRCDAVDLSASRAVFRAGEVAAVALIARRGSMSRLAAMGVAPEARGQGVGRWLMERLIEEACGRGERAMTLEVIEQNAAAVRLYERCGFQTLRRLVGYTLERAEGVTDSRLQEVDLREVARMLTAHGAPDLPWQASGETLAQMGLPNRGYRLGPAFAAISRPEQSPVGIRALVVAPEARRQGWASRLVRALQAQHPGRMWKVPALYPEDLSPGLFEKLGFLRDTLSQQQMTLPLPSGV
jgi:ribosomal protein S18 acetylase RimI-like enzyme